MASMTLRAWLDLSGVRPADLADRIGVSVATVYRWRAGTVPKLRHARSISRETGGRVPVEAWIEKGPQP